jgi:nitroreductase
MKVSEALPARKSVRAFLDTPVPDKATIEDILDKARWAPSGTNTQPWEVVVVRGDRRRALTQAMEARFLSGESGHMEYRYYPEVWHEPFRMRRRACGLQLYSALGIGREDQARQKDQWAANFRGFDAPVLLFFFMDRRMQTGSFMDFGMFLQSVMLMAVEHGLATCPQAALGEFPDLVREHLGVEDDRILVCGMAMGYEKKDAPVNSYRTPREPISAFTRFLE